MRIISHKLEDHTPENLDSRRLPTYPYATSGPGEQLGYSLKIEDNKPGLPLKRESYTESKADVKHRAASPDDLNKAERLKRPHVTLPTTAKTEPKVEEKTDVAVTDVGADQPTGSVDAQRPSEELSRPGSSAAHPHTIIRYGRVLPRVEVVISRPQDVRLQRARQATSDPRPAGPNPDAISSQANDRLQMPGMDAIDSGPSMRSSGRGADPEEEDVKVPIPPPNSETLRSALQQLRNPDVKVKEELLFDDGAILDALGWEDIHHRFPIPLPRHIAEYGFVRKYISSMYGGSPQSTFPNIDPDKLALHGLNHWAFLTLDFNPHAPTRPGYPGLFFHSRRARGEWHGAQQPMRTFICNGDAKWIYLGQYRFEPKESVQPQAWIDQKPQVRRAWGKGLMKKGWGVAVCVRVWLRKTTNNEPSEEEEKEATVNIDQIRAELTEDDILAAYDSGQEEIGIYKMTCVDYDAEFVRVLERNAHLYVVPKQFGKAGTAKAGRSKGRGQKRKINEVAPNAAEGNKRVAAPARRTGSRETASKTQYETRSRTKRTRT